MHIKSFNLKTSQVKRNNVILDGKKNNILGRLATEVAILLKGKHKTTYTPHVLCGDKVTIINANFIQVTGKKYDQKIYRKHTGYFGGLKEKFFKEMKKKDIVFLAIKGMLRKGPQRNQMMKNLRIYEGEKE